MPGQLTLTAAVEPVTPDPGVYTGVPWDEYAAWDCYSKSMVGATLRSGLHLHDYIHGERRRATGMAMGSLVDCLLLEPGLFGSRYIAQPDTYLVEVSKGRGKDKTTEVVEKPWNGNATACREFAADAVEQGLELVSPADMATAEAMRDAVIANDQARRTIHAGEKQVSMVWRDEATGILCKGRADLVLPGCIVDLKTARDASPDEFSRALARFGYHVQGHAYCTAWEQLRGEPMGFSFIVVENGDVPAVALYELAPAALTIGGLVWRRALDRVAWWIQYGVQGYSVAWQAVTVPAWVERAETGGDDV